MSANRRFKRLKKAVILSAAALVAAAALCFSACSDQSFTYITSFYFVYCYEADGAVEASSLSQAVSGIGGAGYTLEYGGKYYIAASCYYREADALSVCESLNRRGLSCGVLSAKRESYSLSTPFARKNSRGLKGAVDSLYGAGKVLYECANGLDTGLFSQSEAKSSLKTVQSLISEVMRADYASCFSPYLNYLYSLCEECVYGGFIYSRDVRYIQIASADSLLKVNLA